MSENDNNNNKNNSRKIRLADQVTDLVSTRPSSKEEYFKFLGIPLTRYEFDMDETTAMSFKNSIISLKTGLHARVPMVCPGGVRCPVGRQCDFTKFKVDSNGTKIPGPDGLPVIDSQTSEWPLFQPCPYESSLIAMRVQDLCLEYGVDPTDPTNITDMSTISKLAELDIYDARASQVLANEAIILDETTGFEMHGEHREITAKRLHPAFEIKEKIHRMRSDLVRSMVGDRQSKVKAQAALGSAQKSTLTDMMSQLKRKILETSVQNVILEAEVIEITTDND